MKKINEYELLDRVNGLREKIVESEQQAQEDVMGTLAKYAAPVGNAIKGAAGKAWNGIKAAGSAMANNPGKTALGVAGTTALAANALTPGATKPGAPAGAPAGTTAPKGGGKSDPAVLKQQQDLIAKGAKIKADGIMGPATQAAIKQFGGAPAAAPEAPAAAPEAPAAAPAAVPAANPMAQDPAQQQQAAAAAPAGATMDDSDDVNAREFVPPAPAGKPGENAMAQAAAAAPAAAPQGSIATDTTDPLAPNNQPKPAAGKPGENAMAQAAAAPVATNAASLKAAQDAAAGNAPPAAAAPAQKQYGGYGQAPAPAPTTPQQAAAADASRQAIKAESVGFRNDELNRILTLIHHR